MAQYIEPRAGARFAAARSAGACSAAMPAVKKSDGEWSVVIVRAFAAGLPQLRRRECRRGPRSCAVRPRGSSRRALGCMATRGFTSGFGSALTLCTVSAGVVLPLLHRALAALAKCDGGCGAVHGLARCAHCRRARVCGEWHVEQISLPAAGEPCLQFEGSAEWHRSHWRFKAAASRTACTP